MANMAYCRFQNTLKDLQICYEHMGEELSEDEEIAFVELVALCVEIVDDYGGVEVGDQ